MEKGLILNAEDVKKILAEHFGVDVKNVIKSQYSYAIIGAKENELTKG